MYVALLALLPGLLALAAPLAAQTPPQSLFPGLLDETLREAVAATYSPAAVPSEDDGKDLLYSVIDRETRDGLDGAAGIYTDYFVAFDCVPDCDPSQDVYNGGGGLSQEHTWPRSEGADAGLFERDLHHLYPARNAVNGARGNLPFGESPDGETSAWYYLDRQQSTPPPADERDRWSERQGATWFEPREGREGDIARAMFYAYAVYGPAGTGQANPAFWDRMRPYLLAWHREDPATVENRARSDRVAAYQTTASGAVAINPFVVDSSLAARTFYPETLPTAAEPAAAPRPLLLDIAGPNPFRGTTAVAFTLSAPARVRVAVYDVLGQEVAVLVDREVALGRYEASLDGARLPGGVYLVRLEAEGTARTQRLTRVR